MRQQSYICKVIAPIRQLPGDSWETKKIICSITAIKWKGGIGNPRYKGVASGVTSINTVISPFIEHRASLVAPNTTEHLCRDMHIFHNMHQNINIVYPVMRSLQHWECSVLWYILQWESLSIKKNRSPQRDQATQSGPITTRSFCPALATGKWDHLDVSVICNVDRTSLEAYMAMESVPQPVVENVLNFFT